MPPITYQVQLDTLRTGGFAGSIDDLSSYTTEISWRCGMNVPYQEVADRSSARIVLDNRAQAFTPEVTGAELVANGGFGTWSGGNPSSWTVTGESGSDPEVSQVASYNGHGGGGSGACNLYTTSATVSISQTILTVGLTYCVTLNLTRAVSGAVRVYNGSTAISPPLRNAGKYTYYFNAGATTLKIENSGACDITIDDVSCKQTSRYRMMAKGMLVRIRGTYSAVTKQYYIGRIQDIDYGIDPQSGQIGGKSVTITLEDPLTDLIEAEYLPPLLENVTAHDVLTRLFGDVVVRWPYSSGFWMLGVQGASELGVATTLYSSTLYSGEAGISEHEFVGDFADRGHGVSGYGYIRDVIEAECGGRFWWSGRDGQFKFHSRHHDTLNTTVVATLTTADDITGIDYVQTPEVFNRVIVNYTQRKIGGAGSVVWELGSVPVRLAHGDQRKFIARYTDTTSRARIGVRTPLNPQVGVDYVANTNSDGSGVDVSERLTVSVEWGASSAKVIFDNQSGSELFIQSAQLRGTPLVAQPATAEAINGDSMRQYDVHERTIETRLLSDINTAQDYAQFVVNKFAAPVGAVQSISFRAYTNADCLSATHNRTIGDRIAVEDTHTGHDADYIIVGEAHQYRAGSAEGHLATYILKPVSREISWVLGTAGLSELDLTTRIAF